MTESTSLLKKLPDKKIIEDIARELGVHESFVEKDWYATEALKIIDQIKDAKFSPVFSGGTSLSKGYGLIERFSEDLDFKILGSGTETGGDRKQYRDKIYQTIRDNGGDLKIIDGSEITRDGRRFFGCSLEYPKIFKPKENIRPHVKLEFSFRQPFLDPERREMRTLESSLRKEPPDLCMPCIRPVETAADKLSAFIWRVLNRDRSAGNDDPTLIRHLHDLAKLEGIIRDDKAIFLDMFAQAYAVDFEQRSKEDLPAEFAKAVELLISSLQGDHLYKAEYETYVTEVSYANDDARISYSDALNSLKIIQAIIVEK